MGNDALEHCPECNRLLLGAVETSSAVVGGMQFVVIEETLDRNWITCDACNLTICKACCVKPDSGYCDKCFFKYKIEPFIP